MMSTDTYEILALAARYWFIAAAALMVMRGWRAAVKDNRNQKILRSWAGGTGCVGELVVLSDGSKQKKKSLRGARFLVPMEGLIGGCGTADIRIRHSDVRRKHVWMHYQAGRMIITPVGRAQVDCPVAPDGKKVLRQGDCLVIGKLTMRMVFFDLKDEVDLKPTAARNMRTAKKASDDDEYDDPFVENFWE